MAGRPNTLSRGSGDARQPVRVKRDGEPHERAGRRGGVLRGRPVGGDEKEPGPERRDDRVRVLDVAAAVITAIAISFAEGTRATRSTAIQAVDQGYGLVCALDGTPIPDLIVIGANQEHGIVAPRPGSGAPPPDMPLGARVRSARVRVLPNHACATAAQYDRYHVLRDGAVVAEWLRFGGW